MKSNLFGRAGLSLVGVIYIAVLALPASAAEEPINYVGGLAHYADPDSERDADEGFGGRLFLGYPLSDRWSLEIGASGTDIKRESDDDRDDFYYQLGPDLLFSFRRNAFTENNFAPFVLAGVGVFHDDVKTNRDTTGYVNAGLGLLIPITEKFWRLRLEARYVYAFSDDAPSEGDPGVITEDSFGEILIGAGVQLNWGAINVTAPPIGDQDGDGVTDDRDRCPNTPKGVPVDINGCPRDDDNDGVPNHQDQCPNTPAGAEVDLRGCEIVKEQDSCLGDCDQDGVINRNDFCPQTLPGLKVDERGCAIKKQTLVLDGIYFEFDKATIKPESKPALDRVAEAMNGQPDMQVEIAGHTDWIGTEKYNQGLSERRAASVRQYLLDAGVKPASRLRSQGYGEKHPIATNETDAGRAKNRRVEFRVLD